MRRAACLVALIIATVLGCLFLLDLYVFRLFYLDNGHHFPQWIGVRGLIAVGATGLASVAFCILFALLGRNHGTAKRSTVKRSIALVIGLLALAYAGYRYRLQVEAKVWHWKHGNVIALGDYEIPVPRQWLVLDQDRSSVRMACTATPSAGGALADAININIPMNLPPGHPSLDLDQWASSEMKISESVGLRFTVQGRVTTRTGDFICLGSKVSPRNPIPSVLMCMSTKGWAIDFAGPPSDIRRFYAIVQGIRRK